MTKLLDIKTLVAQEKGKLKEFFERLDVEPRLNIIQVGNNEASNRYVRNKIKDCQEVGIKAILRNPEETTTLQLQKEVFAQLGPTMVQLPLPAGVEVPTINPHVDVDGFEPDSDFAPCTPGGIMWYLRECGLANGEGKFAVVIGRSDIVGKPMAKMLMANNWTVAVIHSKTRKDIKKLLLLEADLVVCAVGKAGFLDPQECPRAFIIDVGINFDENGKLVGDVRGGAAERTTPVPGGVGLLTRLQLLKNVAKFYGYED